MKVKCLVVDDESLARKGIEEYIERTPYLECSGSVGSAFDAIEFLNNNETDIMFLDIQMPDMTGIELMKTITNPPQVIFTTAHREFALDGFELNAIDYLLKPISYDRFLKAVNKTLILNVNASSRKDCIFVKTDGKIVRILLDEILYVETAKDYIFIYTLQKKYLTLVSMRQIEESLPKSKFMRVHRYYLIGLNHVDKIKGNMLYIKDHRISISRSLRDEVYNKIIGNRLIER